MHTRPYRKTYVHRTNIHTHKYTLTHPYSQLLIHILIHRYILLIHSPICSYIPIYTHTHSPCTITQ